MLKGHQKKQLKAARQDMVSPGIWARFISLSGKNFHYVGRKEGGQSSCSGVTSSKGSSGLRRNVGTEHTTREEKGKVRVVMQQQH